MSERTSGKAPSPLFRRPSGAARPGWTLTPWLSAFLALAVASCATAPASRVLSEPERFLVEKLDEAAKARALTEAGIEQYTIHLVRRSEYEQIGAVRAYFATALSFDPANTRAQQYLSLVDSYRTTNLRSSVKEADQLLAKKDRSEAESLRLSLAVQKAVKLDPEDQDVRRLQKDTEGIRAALVQSLLAREQATLAKVAADTPEDNRDRLMIDAYLSANSALSVDPKSSAAQSEQSRLKGEVAKAGDRRLEATRKLVDQGKFTAARSEIAEMEELNRRSGGVLESSVRTATYELDFRWAKWLFERKDYASASVKVDAALAARRTGEAATLKQKITDARKSSEAGENFDAGLKDVDRLIADGELVAAWRELDRLDETTKDKASKAQLAERGTKVRSFLPALYQDGLARYREEKFKEAIESLDAVVQIDVDYEQAADYLEKARAKQRLIEQF